MPAPIARTFFSAPAISTPITSWFVYTLNDPCERLSCTVTASLRFFEATTTSVGILLRISYAKLGPERTQYLSFPWNISSTAYETNVSVSTSIPFEHETNGTSYSMNSLFSLKITSCCWEGMHERMNDAPLTTSLKLDEAEMFPFSSNSEKIFGLQRFVLMC